MRVLVVAAMLFFCATLSPAALTLQWTAAYNGPANSWDEGRGIAVDGNGNVYVVGSSSAVGQDFNIWVRKYNSAGTVQWTTTYNSPANDEDVGRGIAVDGSGNVCVTGHERRYDLGQSYNIWVRKYDTNGLVLWTTTYNSPGNSDDRGSGIAADGNGNLYVTGYEWRGDLGQSYNIWARKYDPNGLVVWTATYNSPANNWDEGRGIAVDGNGNVYVVGRSSEGGQGYNIWVGKYDPNGLVVWTTTYNSPASLWDEGHGIAVGGAGNVYVTGMENRTDLVQGANIWLRKYDPNGLAVWTTTYNSPISSWDEGFGIAVDGSGNVYVTGTEWSGYYNIWARKYDPNGLILWTTTYNSPANGDDIGYGIAVDGSGDVYVTGYEDRSDLGQSTNIWVRKWSQSVPATPSGLTVQDPGTGGALNLKWSANSDGNLRDYRVYRGGASGALTSKAVPATVLVPGTTHQDRSSLVTGSRYFYQITARDVAGSESEGSAEVSGVPTFTNSNQTEFPVTIEVPGVGTVSVMVPRNEVRVVLEKRADVPDGMVSSEANQAIVTAVGNIQPGAFTFRVFTLAGEIIYEKTEEKAALSSWIWIPKDVASGTYFIQVEGPGVKSSKKVVVGR